MPFKTPSLACSYDYKMDPKCRVSIPVPFRPEVEGEPVQLQMSKEHELPLIRVFDIEGFEDKFRKIDEATQLTEKQKGILVGALRMNSREATISPQGKLTVPKDWAEKVGLEAESPVQLGGRGSHFIICTKETLNRINEIEFHMDDGGLGVL